MSPIHYTPCEEVCLDGIGTMTFIHKCVSNTHTSGLWEAVESTRSLESLFSELNFIAMRSIQSI